MLVVTALDYGCRSFPPRLLGHGRRDRGADLIRASALPGAGPRSRELFSGLTDADVAGLRDFRFIPQPITVGGVGGCWVSRTGYSDNVRYEVFCPADGAESLWRALLDAGAHMGIRPYGLAVVARAPVRPDRCECRWSSLLPLHRASRDVGRAAPPVSLMMPDGRLVPAIVDRYPTYDPGKERPQG